MTTFDRSTAEAEIGAFIDALRRSPQGRDELVALLPENLPLYHGRSAVEVTRLRGYLLAAFADTGVPATAMPYLIEALQSGHLAYEVAGAAIGLRGTQTPSVHMVPHLLRAIDNLDGTDATVNFDSYAPRWPYPHPTTALTELIRTIGYLGLHGVPVLAELEHLAAQHQRFSRPLLAEMRSTIKTLRGRLGECAGGEACQCESCTCASSAVPAANRCCCDNPTFITHPETEEHAVPSAMLEDQDGRSESFQHYYRGRPSVVAFFYTRCDNPYKCSLTITKLAALQHSLKAQGLDGVLRTTAITYDPDFDLPHRLKLYGVDRGIHFGEDTRFFRTTSGFPEMRQYFQLGVNYGPSTVNRHQIEVYVLDRHGEIAARFTRLQFEIDEVLAAVKKL